MASNNITNDPALLADYCDRMAALREKSYAHPLQQGTRLQLSLPAWTARGETKGRRIIPDLVLSTLGKGFTSWYLERPLQSGVNISSQVWIASTRLENDLPVARIVLKIFQESRTKYPTTESSPYELSYYQRQDEIVSNAVRAYDRVSKCQGSTLPYFFGAHKSTAPSGETIDIMAFEYLHGPSMLTYRDSKNTDDARFAKWKEWDNYRLLAASFVKTMKLAHECKIIHRDLSESNLIIDEENSRIVVIDWELCVIDGEDHEFWQKQELQTVQHMVQRYAGKKYREAVLELLKSSRPL